MGLDSLINSLVERNNEYRHNLIDKSPLIVQLKSDDYYSNKIATNLIKIFDLTVKVKPDVNLLYEIKNLPNVEYGLLYKGEKRLMTYNKDYISDNFKIVYQYIEYLSIDHTYVNVKNFILNRIINSTNPIAKRHYIYHKDYFNSKLTVIYSLNYELDKMLEAYYELYDFTFIDYKVMKNHILRYMLTHILVRNSYNVEFVHNCIKMFPEFTETKEAHFLLQLAKVKSIVDLDQLITTFRHLFYPFDIKMLDDIRHKYTLNLNILKSGI